MIRDIRQKLPKWLEDGYKYQMCLSDDIDSLLGCTMLNKVVGYEVNYFFSFTKMYNGQLKKDKAVGVDLSLVSGRTWDNHVVILSRRDRYNKESANLNTVYKIDRNSYTSKYAGSTVLQIYSYYKIPLPSTDEGKMLLLAIDSAYKGHYISSFKSVQNEWLRKLELEELIDVQERYSQRDFERLARKHNLNAKIKVNEEGYLESDLKLEEISKLLEVDVTLPTMKFSHTLSCTNERDTKRGHLTKKSLAKDDVLVTMALTGKNCISYSKLITKENVK